MNIVGSICVDEDKRDDTIQYLSIPNRNGLQRRSIYWRCAVVSFATSMRCNPQARHILFTNDRQPVWIGKIEAKQFLRTLGVEIREVPFETFKPPAGFSENFKNAFFKLDVIEKLAREKDSCHLLLDLDCVWTKPGNELLDELQAGCFMLYDNYEMKDSFRKIHGMSMAEMGTVYQEIDPTYPMPHPILFGGEFIGGNTEHFQTVAEGLLKAFRHIVSKYPLAPPKFAHQQSIFDNDEYLSSYVYNQLALPWKNAKPYIRRINTDISYSTARTSDMDLAIWHLLDEKTQGFPLLYKQVVDSKSRFWTLPLSEWNTYLGSYLGVPKSVTTRRYTMIAQKLVEKSLKKVRKALRT